MTATTFHRPWSLTGRRTEGAESPNPAGHVEPAGLVEPRWLREVRLRASRRVLFARHRWSGSGYANEHLLAISHSEVDRALEPAARTRAEEATFYRADPDAFVLSQAIEALGDAAEDPRWAHLIGTLGIEPADQSLLALALAAALDTPFTRVLGYISDGVGASGATPALVADLFGGHDALGPDPGSAALAWQLLAPAASERGTSSSTTFEADPALVRSLLGPQRPGGANWSIGCAGRRLRPPDDAGVRPAQTREVAEFVADIWSGQDQIPPIEIELVGPPGSGRRTLASRVAAALGIELIVVDAAELTGDDPRGRLVREARRAVLEKAALAIVGGDDGLPDELVGRAAAALHRCPLVFLCTPRPARSSAGAGAVRRSVPMTALDRRDRLELWSLLGDGPAPVPVAEWALRPGEIATAARVVPAGEAAVAEVCRRLLVSGTTELFTSLPLPFTWDDLVLAPDREAHLRELEAQARNRSAVLDEWGFGRLTPMGRGTTALFAGPSGTGKTMTAQVLARSLGVDCVRVDLAGVVSKYIGETEKQLRRLFEACERAPTLLLFDEADALFGKRTQVSDAHDRYANIEIDYLLQQMERFDGLAVLATNRKGDLDTAFVRRLRFIVQFSPPTTSERERLWRLYLEGSRDAQARPLVADLDYGAIAAELDLTAADIKSAALAAAHLAFSEGSRIELSHVLAAGRRELEKQGQVVRSGRREAP